MKKWCHDFKLGRQPSEDAPRSGRPVTTHGTVARVQDMVMSDRRITVWRISKATGIPCMWHGTEDFDFCRMLCKKNEEIVSKMGSANVLGRFLLCRSTLAVSRWGRVGESETTVCLWQVVFRASMFILIP